MSLSFVLSGKMLHCQKAVQKIFSHHYDIVQLNYGSASTKRPKLSQDALQYCRWCWMLALFRVLHSSGALRPSRGASGMWGLAQLEAKQNIVLIYKTNTMAWLISKPFDEVRRSQSCYFFSFFFLVVDIFILLKFIYLF